MLAPLFIPDTAAAESLWLPDPRLEMPELLIPGRKPYGRVVIDWEHPLAEGLEAFVLFGATGIDAHDLVSGRTLTRTGPSFAAEIDSNGSHVNITATNTYYTLFDDTDAHIPLDQGTIMALVKKGDSTSRQSTLFGTVSSSPRIGAHVPWTSNLVIFDFNSTSDRITYTDTDLVNQTYSAWVFSAGSGGMRIIRNGVQKQSTGTAPTPRSGTTTAFRINNGPYNEGDIQRYYAFAVFSKERSKGDCESLSKNPYQFLVPA